MAKLKLGPLATQISGSIGSTTFSHNRGGAYMRNRAIADTHISIPAMQAKDRLGRISGKWSDLTDPVRSAWTEWARQHPVTDRLGEVRPLDGHQAFVKCMTRLDQMGVSPLPATPPTVPAPIPAVAGILVYDIGSGGVSLAFTPSPTGANEYIWLQGALLVSNGISYVDNVLKYVHAYGPAQTTALDFHAEFEAIWGVPTVGQRVSVLIQVIDITTGLVSTATRADTLVISTP